MYPRRKPCGGHTPRAHKYERRDVSLIRQTARVFTALPWLQSSGRFLSELDITSGNHRRAGVIALSLTLSMPPRYCDAISHTSFATMLILRCSFSPWIRMTFFLCNRYCVTMLVFVFRLLRENKLTELEDDVFMGAFDIKQLWLGENQLAKFSAAHFRHMPELGIL